MKLFIYICLLVVVIGPSVKAKSFNFGNFFLGSSKKALDSDSAIPPNLFDSSQLDYSTEVDSDAFNSSSDDTIDFDNQNSSSGHRMKDFDYQNSSSDSLEFAGRSESENIPDISDSTAAPVAEAVENNETLSTGKNETTTPPSSIATSEKPTTTLAEVSATARASNESQSAVVTEQEGVVLGTTTGATVVLIPRTFVQKSIDWVKDAYTLSILVPITAGVLFATTIIVVVFLCRCLRRCCRRRRFKRKPLPDSVKSLRPEDRARLLGDTSDEEF